ncbi:MAG: DUF3365 domain-containing protein [Deltaproteobacteria bacterium]|nr:DUF3365 domain-containing protein [Deltaproteobacteria bacterium]
MFGIRAKLLIFAALVWVVIFGIYGAYTYWEKVAQTKRLAVKSAALLAGQTSAMREYYTASVLSDKDIHRHDSAQKVPLPTVFTREVSERLRLSEGYFINIMSAYPINPSKGPADSFEQEGLRVLSVGEASRFYDFENYNGKYSVRYLSPDFATNQRCVDCHNSHPSSPRKNYKLGEMMGAIEVVVPIEDELALVIQDVWRSIGYGFVVILTMGIAGLAFTTYVVSSPVSRLAETASHMSSGDLTKEVTVTTNDEIGALGRQTNEVVKNLHSMIKGIRATSEEAGVIAGNVSDMGRHVVEGSYIQATSLDSITGSMERINSSIGEIARGTEALAGSAQIGFSSVQELAQTINEVADNTGLLFLNVNEAVSSTSDMSASIKAVYGSVESLFQAAGQASASMVDINARIKEVESNTVETARIAEVVISDAKSGMISVERTIEGIIRIKGFSEDATAVIISLSKRIMEIGRILDVMRDIAEETNILALNAAIVAAKAGGPGKGFSVVSNEIKDLAERSSMSAKEVSGIIEAIRHESEKAVAAMERGLESVEDGVSLSGEARAQLEKIVESSERSTNRVREIARATVEQSRASRQVVDSASRVTQMAERIVAATEEQARNSEHVNKAVLCMKDITSSVNEATREQVEATKRITATMEEVNRMVTYINTAILEQGRGSTKILSDIEAVREVSLKNIEKARQTEDAVELLAKLNRTLTEGVRRFKLEI